jgi:hypothetical protein
MMRLPKRRKQEPLGLKDAPQIRNASHLAWIRGHVCSVNASDCSDRIEAAHVRTGTDGGMGVKPGDNWTIPLCSDHHHDQHQVGEAQFERYHSIDMKAIAQALWQRSPHRPRP